MQFILAKGFYRDDRTRQPAVWGDVGGARLTGCSGPIRRDVGCVESREVDAGVRAVLHLVH